MTVGIEKINLYASRFRTDAMALALARGRDESYVEKNVLVKERSVIPTYEDSVTLAVNACKPLLRDVDRSKIELLVVATESGVDFGKPNATWVHRYCDLPSNCRLFDLKHACYGATAGLKLALKWLLAGSREDQKALVVSADFSRGGLGMEHGFDFVGGGCGVAMLVGFDPHVLEIDPERAGYWSSEIADTFRPTARDEVGDNELSLFSYLDALDGAYDHFEKRCGPVDFFGRYHYNVYHAPFPGMTLQAHRNLVSRLGLKGKAAFLESFDERVRPGLYFAQRIGGAYGASNTVSLLGLLQDGAAIEAGDRISVFAYGSGCTGEFYEVTVGDEATRQVEALRLDEHLDGREMLDVKQYEEFMRERDDMIDRPDYEVAFSRPEGSYERLYEGRDYLVLRRIERFQRRYAWS